MGELGIEGEEMKYRLILSTVPDEKVGGKIAKRLLKEKLCACVNILPKMTSLYWWQGKMDSSNESLLFIKTTQSKVKRLISSLRKIHPYEVPEVIALEIKEGEKEYLNWISDSVK